jgi:uroporphyrinogen decarboxylase
LWACPSPLAHTVSDSPQIVIVSITALLYVCVIFVCLFALIHIVIEGGSSSTYMKTKKLMYEHPDTAHLLFRKLADNVVEYVKYQIANGAQVVQLFDSWAGNLSPKLYKEFAGNYHKYIISRVKQTYPDVPLILFVHKGVGAFLDEMVRSGADIVNIDWTHNLKDIRAKINMQKNMELLKRSMNAQPAGVDENGNLLKKPIILQGNMDPMVLHTNKEIISREVNHILSQTKGVNHIMNLGHGIDQTTKEEHVLHFVNSVKKFKVGKGQ